MAKSMLNFNIGVLGHVDSGKTSLAKALSTVASTASFDKNPQSRDRGITLDLGFSSFSVPTPEHIKKEIDTHDQLQFTLVDCPGHASLIRTIIGGAQIIDLMMLVIDVTKGMQTQTAECLVIGEIACSKMIVVLNKIDVLPEAKKSAAIEKMTKRIHKTLENSKFAACPVIPVAAKPGGPEAEGIEASGIQDLIEKLRENTFLPKRDPSGSFIFAVDHCFSIRGQGTVMTGTVLNGNVRINDNIEIPSMKINKKIKSMQMFRKPVEKAIQGDRVGLCVTQFDPKQLERGLVCTPGALPTIDAAIVTIKRIQYYKGPIATKAKFHISLMHETVMAKVSIFGYYGNEMDKINGSEFNYDESYLYQDELIDINKGASDDDAEKLPKMQFALLEFERPVTCANSCLIIGSKLDTDIHTASCRLAFHGTLLEGITDPKYHENILPRLKVFKYKSKEGVVERKNDDYSVICKGLFKKESKIDNFVGLRVKLSTGENGVIEGGFGQSGKFKVRIPDGLQEETSKALAGKGKKGKAKLEAETQEPVTSGEIIRLTLEFKRFMYDPKKQMQQT